MIKIYINRKLIINRNQDFNLVDIQSFVSINGFHSFIIIKIQL